MIVIYCINKYFIKSSFLQSVHVMGQFRNYNYLWKNPDLCCIGSSLTEKTMVRLAFIYNFHPSGQCHLVLPHVTFWGVGMWVFRKTSKWRFVWQFGYGRHPLVHITNDWQLIFTTSRKECTGSKVSTETAINYTWACSLISGTIVANTKTPKTYIWDYLGQYRILTFQTLRGNIPCGYQ